MPSVPSVQDYRSHCFVWLINTGFVCRVKITYLWMCKFSAKRGSPCSSASCNHGCRLACSFNCCCSLIHEQSLSSSSDVRPATFQRINAWWNTSFSDLAGEDLIASFKKGRSLLRIPSSCRFPQKSSSSCRTGDSGGRQ